MTEVWSALKRDTAANWTSENPVLKDGQPGLETDTLKTKFGDGVTAWNSLPYATNPAPTLADGDYGDIVVSSSGTAINIDSSVLSAFGRTLIDDADASAARTTLGLGSAATEDAANFAASGDILASGLTSDDGKLLVGGADSLIYPVAIGGGLTLSGDTTAGYTLAGGGGGGGGADSLTQLDDVTISGAAGNDLLYYDSGASLWKNGRKGPGIIAASGVFLASGPLPVNSVGDETPPGSPSDGDIYCLGASPTGAWSGQAGKIAFYNTSSWVFLTPETQMLVRAKDEGLDYRWSGSAWVAVAAGGAVIGGAYRTSSQSIANATWTTVTFQSEYADEASIWSGGAPTEFAIPAGKTWWQMHVFAYWASSAAGLRGVRITNPGVTVAYGPEVTVPTASNGQPGLYTSPPILASGVTSVVVQVYQDSGGSLNLQGGSATLYQQTYALLKAW